MIQIKECGEPLVDLKKACPGLIIQLNSKRRKKEKTIYLRKTVAEMICQAKKNLPKGMTFVVGDGWRPQYMQKEIFTWFIKHCSNQFPTWSKSKVIKKVKEYVAPLDGDRASGHMTGGAIDLRLWKNNRKIPMKSSKLTYQENAQSSQPKLPKHIQKNRKILFDVLSKTKLTNCEREYWHWSYGDFWWAKRGEKKTAIYGVIKDVNIK